MRTFRSILIVSLVKGMTYGLVFVTALIVINANVTTEAGNANECWNEHTAQINVIGTNEVCPDTDPP